MEISNFTFIVTDNCNFNCSYCMQKKENKTISNQTIQNAVEFFYPFFNHENSTRIAFYGGEPLMAFDKIQFATRLLFEKNKNNKPDSKKIEFHITTNGSLLTHEMLEFFNLYRFTLLLSFDGLAQDNGRKKDSLESTLLTMKLIQTYAGISFEINSVFSPQTVERLFESIQYIIEHEGPDITFNLSITDDWTRQNLETLRIELKRLADYVSNHYKKTGHIPVKNFLKNPRGNRNIPLSRKDVFRCSAGRNHLAITPEAKLWGCFLFHDYFKTRETHPQYPDYSFGDLEYFIANYKNLYPAILTNYEDLRQDFFQAGEVDCFLCTRLSECAVCPVIGAYSTGSIGKIPCCKCSLLKIESELGCKFF